MQPHTPSNCGGQLPTDTSAGQFDLYAARRICAYAIALLLNELRHHGQTLPHYETLTVKEILAFACQYQGMRLFFPEDHELEDLYRHGLIESDCYEKLVSSLNNKPAVSSPSQSYSPATPR